LLRQQNNHAPLSSRTCLASCFCLAIILSPPAFAATPFELARHFIESGQHTEARRALESELRIRPKNLDARYNLAILLEEIGHSDQAKALYQKNISIGRHLPSLINLASAMNREGKKEQAEMLLKKATRLFRSEATPWYLLAQQAASQGKNAQSIQLFLKAIKTDPLNGFAYLHYADFQSQHQFSDMGIKHSKKASRLLPECAPCWRKCGDILARAGKQNAALNAYQRSLAIKPDDKTRQQLVITLRSLGHSERANDIQQGLDASRKYQINN